jgi:hypothetical protein
MYHLLVDDEYRYLLISINQPVDGILMGVLNGCPEMSGIWFTDKYGNIGDTLWGVHGTPKVDMTL